MVPAAMRGSYTGTKFKAEVAESVTVPADAGLWDGGSRETYRAIELATGRDVPLIDHNASPWDNRKSITFKLEPGFAVVRHSMFCGKDMGLTFYVHASNAAALLPAPVELTPVQRLVLTATSSLKSSYGGRDRYQMAQDEYSCKQVLGDLPYPSREEWDRTKAQLIDRGFLNKAGAITVAGRNAVQD
jgi:hypothetical protein